jgi:hypothetical protein
MQKTVVPRRLIADIPFFQGPYGHPSDGSDLVFLRS